MPCGGQGAQDAVAGVDLRLDGELVAKPAERVERAEGASRGRVEADEEGELRVGDGLAVGADEVGELVGGAREARVGEERGEGVEGGEAVAEALLAAGPVEEGEGERGRRRRARAEDLGHERGGHAAELGEVGDDGRAPAVVAAEGVEEEARERGEAAGGGGYGMRQSGRRARGVRGG